MVLTDQRGPKAREARRASRVKLDPQALMASLDPRASLVLQVSADPLVRRDSPGRLGPKVQPVRMEPLARKAPRGPRAAPVLQGLLARMEPRATQDLAVLLDLRVLPVRMQSFLSVRRTSPPGSPIALVSSTSPRSSTRRTLW